MSSDIDNDTAHLVSDSTAAAKKWLEKFPPKDEADVLLVAHFFKVLSNAPAKTHTVFRPLWESYVARLKAYLETPKQQRTGEKLDELEELRSWLFPRERFTTDHADFAGNLFVGRGDNYTTATAKIREIRKRSAGRPRSTASMALRGLELQISNPQLTWVELADQVCDCESGKHDSSCVARLKPAIASLRVLLQKFSPQR